MGTRSVLSSRNKTSDTLRLSQNGTGSQASCKSPLFDTTQFLDVDDEVFQKGVNENSKRSSLTPNGTRLKPRFPSASFITPKKLSSVEFLESPLRRKLHSVGIESVHQNLIKLGQGTFGTVLLGFWKGMHVAVKVLGNESRVKCKLRRRNSIESELNVMNLSHENIVKVYATFQSEEDNDHSIVVMEYVGHSSLQNIIEEYSSLLTPTFIHSALLQIASALSHCHERNVLHLDVKPSNVLVSSNGLCKLADFGCSIRTTAIQGDSGKTKKKMYLVGTPGFQAPELLQNFDPSPKCDVFSFGILMWQVLSKERMPFPGLHMHTIMFKVVSQSFRPNESLTSNVHSSYMELYKICWDQKPHKRPTMNHVVKVLSQISVEDAVEKEEKKRVHKHRLLR